MEAMEYEFLLRRIYNCGRRGVPGADADIYRKMEHAERAYSLDLENIKNRTVRISNQSIEEMQYEYERECVSLWLYISKAVGKAIQEYGYKLTKDELSKLTKLAKRPTDLSKKVIDEIIDITNDILAKHEIHPG